MVSKLRRPSAKTEELSGTHLPIIAMTAHAMEGDRQRCFAAGMDAYIAKPIKVEELVEMIENLSPTTLGGKAQVVGPEFDCAAMDVTAALARVGGDSGLLNEIAELFLAELPEIMTTLREAVMAGDANAIQRGAHKLKGSVGNFDAQPAFAAALKLETLAHGGSIDETTPAFVALETEIERLTAALGDLRFPEAPR